MESVGAEEISNTSEVLIRTLFHVRGAPLGSLYHVRNARAVGCCQCPAPAPVPGRFGSWLQLSPFQHPSKGVSEGASKYRALPTFS